MLVKVFQMARQHDRVVGIFKDEPIHAVGDDLRTPIIDASDDGKAAGHSFQRRKSESILASGTYVSVGHRLKVDGIRRIRFPAALLSQVQPFSRLKEEGRRGVLTCD